MSAPVLEVGQGWLGFTFWAKTRAATRALRAKGPPDLRRGDSVCLHLGSLSLLTTTPHKYGEEGQGSGCPPRSSSGEGVPTVGGVLMRRWEGEISENYACHYGEMIITLTVFFCRVRQTFERHCALAAVLPLQSSGVCFQENQHISSCVSVCVFVGC